MLAAVLASLVLAVISEFFFPGHITLGAGFMKSLYVPGTGPLFECYYWQKALEVLTSVHTNGTNHRTRRALRWPPHSGNAARRGES